LCIRQRAARHASLAGAAQGAVLVIPGLNEKIESQLGHSVCLSSVYRMLARHGWRKLAPDAQHPQGNAQAREEWKKNSCPIWRKCAPDSQDSSPSG
jgi:hypothetical protein